MRNLKNYIKGAGLFTAITLLSSSSFAAVTDTNQSGGLSNTTVFYILLALAIILLIAIFFLTNSVKELVQSDFYKKKMYEEETKRKNNTGTVASLLMLIGVPFASFSQTIATSASVNSDMPVSWVWTMVIICLILLGVVFYVRNLFFQILRSVKPKKIVEVATKSEVKEVSKLSKILVDVVPIEREHEIMMDHEYDGIYELDNNLPPWWIWSFYACIVFAVVYLFNYHIIEISPLQEEEYNIEIAEGKRKVAEYLASQKLNVNESNVIMLTASSDLSGGEKIFMENCKACHGAMGEGGIGPNLTDDYWLHGGDIKSVFKIVKYGVQEKGMQSWKKSLSAIQMQQVSSYIKNIKGKAVGMESAKEPQGELYTEESEEGITQIASDSTNNMTDSTSVALN